MLRETPARACGVQGPSLARGASARYFAASASDRHFATPVVTHCTHGRRLDQLAWRLRRSPCTRLKWRRQARGWSSSQERFAKCRRRLNEDHCALLAQGFGEVSGNAWQASRDALMRSGLERQGWRPNRMSPQSARGAIAAREMAQRRFAMHAIAPTRSAHSFDTAAAPIPAL